MFITFANTMSMIGQSSTVTVIKHDLRSLKLPLLSANGMMLDQMTLTFHVKDGRIYDSKEIEVSARDITVVYDTVEQLFMEILSIGFECFTMENDLNSYTSETAVPNRPMVSVGPITRSNNRKDQLARMTSSNSYRSWRMTLVWVTVVLVSAGYSSFGRAAANWQANYNESSAADKNQAEHNLKFPRYQQRLRAVENFLKEQGSLYENLWIAFIGTGVYVATAVFFSEAALVTFLPRALEVFKTLSRPNDPPRIKRK